MTRVNCPTCGRIVEWTPRVTWRPFCSERCKLIDLGAWADGSHRIPGETADIAGQDLPAPSKSEADRES